MQNFGVLSQCTIIHSNRFRWTCRNSVKSPPLLRKVYFSKIWPSFHAFDGKVTLKTSDRAVLKATWTFIWSEGKIFSAWLKFYFYFPLCGCFRDLIIVHFSRPLPKIKWHLLRAFRKARDRVWPSSISSIVRAWVSIIEWFCKGESLGNGKSTERFVKKIDKNSILLFIWSFSTTYHTCLNWNFTFCVTVQTKSGKLLSGAWKKG